MLPNLSSCCRHIDPLSGTPCWPSIPGQQYATGFNCEPAKIAKERDWLGQDRRWVANFCDGSVATPYIELVRAAADAVRVKLLATAAWCDEPPAPEVTAGVWASNDVATATALTQQVLRNSRVWKESRQGLPRILCYVPALSTAAQLILDTYNTWGAQCDRLIFFVDVFDSDLEQKGIDQVRNSRTRGCV